MTTVDDNSQVEQASNEESNSIDSENMDENAIETTAETAVVKQEYITDEIEAVSKESVEQEAKEEPNDVQNEVQTKEVAIEDTNVDEYQPTNEDILETNDVSVDTLKISQTSDENNVNEEYSAPDMIEDTEEPEINQELELEQKPETEPELKQETEPEPDPEQEPKPELEQETELEPEKEPEVEQRSEPEQKPKQESQSKPYQEPELEQEPEQELKQETEPEINQEQEPEIEPEQEPQPEPYQEPTLEQKPETESEQEPEQELREEPQPEPELEQEPELKEEPEPKPEPELEQEPELQQEQEPESEPKQALGETTSPNKELQETNEEYIEIATESKIEPEQISNNEISSNDSKPNTEEIPSTDYNEDTNEPKTDISKETTDAVIDENIEVDDDQKEKSIAEKQPDKQQTIEITTDEPIIDENTYKTKTETNDTSVTNEKNAEINDIEKTLDSQSKDTTTVVITLEIKEEESIEYNEKKQITPGFVFCMGHLPIKHDDTYTSTSITIYYKVQSVIDHICKCIQYENNTEINDEFPLEMYLTVDQLRFVKEVKNNEQEKKEEEEQISVENKQITYNVGCVFCMGHMPIHTPNTNEDNDNKDDNKDKDSTSSSSYKPPITVYYKIQSILNLYYRCIQIPYENSTLVNDDFPLEMYLSLNQLQFVKVLKTNASASNSDSEYNYELNSAASSSSKSSENELKPKKNKKLKKKKTRAQLMAEKFERMSKENSEVKVVKRKDKPVVHALKIRSSMKQKLDRINIDPKKKINPRRSAKIGSMHSLMRDGELDEQPKIEQAIISKGKRKKKKRRKLDIDGFEKKDSEENVSPQLFFDEKANKPFKSSYATSPRTSNVAENDGGCCIIL